MGIDRGLEVSWGRWDFVSGNSDGEEEEEEEKGERREDVKWGELEMLVLFSVNDRWISWC